VACARAARLLGTAEGGRLPAAGVVLPFWPARREAEGGRGGAEGLLKPPRRGGGLAAGRQDGARGGRRGVFVTGGGEEAFSCSGRKERDRPERDVQRPI